MDMGTFSVTGEEAGVVRVEAGARLVGKRTAVALCAEIERAAASHPGKPRLLIDLSALSRATPPAGIYAIRRMKALDPEAIAIFRANRFMRGFARVVMRLARFRSFGLFSEEREARAWLESGGAP